MFCPLCKLCLSRSIYGANVCASAALDASVSVDNVLTVTLSNCIYRALTLACAAGDALIVNYICHEKILLFVGAYRVATRILSHGFFTSFALCLYQFLKVLFNEP
jgi:hypothetical protein